jgi:cytochrome b involved in lipid metabolism
MAGVPRAFTAREVASHASRASCWIVLSGRVLDVTRFLDEHPGGEDILLHHAGRDCTSDFEAARHSQFARSLTDKYAIGVLAAEAAPAPAPAPAPPAPSAPPVAQKTPVAPGRSPLHWARFAETQRPRPLVAMTAAELARHDTEGDAWVAIGGFVFDVTAYLEYHPGGKEQLMRAAGRDGTRLFSEVHPWVNVMVILKNFVVGRLESAARK